MAGALASFPVSSHHQPARLVRPPVLRRGALTLDRMTTLEGLGQLGQADDESMGTDEEAARYGSGSDWLGSLTSIFGSAAHAAGQIVPSILGGGHTYTIPNQAPVVVQPRSDFSGLAMVGLAALGLYLFAGRKR